jgi:hypothetical protein
VERSARFYEQAFGLERTFERLAYFEDPYGHRLHVTMSQ